MSDHDVARRRYLCSCVMLACAELRRLEHKTARCKPLVGTMELCVLLILLQKLLSSRWLMHVICISSHEGKTQGRLHDYPVRFPINPSVAASQPIVTKTDNALHASARFYSKCQSTIRGYSIPATILLYSHILP